MNGPIGAARTERIGALGGSGARTGTRAAGAMTSLAGRVASSIGRELGLIDPDARGGRGGGGANDDLYEVAQTARSLNDGLGGRAVDEGLLARSLGLFVTESASLIAARPRAPSLQLIEGAIARVEAERLRVAAPETVATALQDIDRTAAQVAGRSLR